MNNHHEQEAGVSNQLELYKNQRETEAAVLDAVSEAAAGTVIVVQGLSGSGKTTLLETIESELSYLDVVLLSDEVDPHKFVQESSYVCVCTDQITGNKVSDDTEVIKHRGFHPNDLVEMFREQTALSLETQKMVAEYSLGSAVLYQQIIQEVDEYDPANRYKFSNIVTRESFYFLITQVDISSVIDNRTQTLAQAISEALEDFLPFPQMMIDYGRNYWDRIIDSFSKKEEERNLDTAYFQFMNQDFNPPFVFRSQEALPIWRNFFPEGLKIRIEPRLQLVANVPVELVDKALSVLPERALDACEKYNRKTGLSILDPRRDYSRYRNRSGIMIQKIDKRLRDGGTGIDDEYMRRMEKGLELAPDFYRLLASAGDHSTVHDVNMGFIIGIQTFCEQLGIEYVLSLAGNGIYRYDPESERLERDEKLESDVYG